MTTGHVNFGAQTWRIPAGWTMRAGDRPTTCAACQALILFAVSDKSGKRAPFDPVPPGDGKVVSVSHFATCPEAARFRRPRDAQEGKGR